MYIIKKMFGYNAIAQEFKIFIISSGLKWRCFTFLRACLLHRGEVDGVLDHFVVIGHQLAVDGLEEGPGVRIVPNRGDRLLRKKGSSRENSAIFFSPHYFAEMYNKNTVSLAFQHS